MSDVAQAGLADGEHAGATLDSIIEGAIEKAGSAEASTATAADSASSEAKTDKLGRLHGDRGKFVGSKPISADTASGTEHAAAAKPGDQPQALDPAKQQPIEAPARWTTEEKAKFAGWPRDVQEAVSERNKTIEAEFTRKSQEAAEIRRNAEPFLNAIKPFENYLSQLGPVTGQQAPQLIAGLLGVEYRLRTGSAQEKYSALATIARQYGVDLAALARGEVVEPDPHFNQVRQELSDLQNWKSQVEQQAQQQQVEQTSLHIESFATAKDDAGRPRYPHFERVRGVMAQSLMGGEAKTLEEAYSKATAPIQEAIAEELRSRQQAADTQRQQAVSRADRAAPIRSSGSQPGGSARGGDLDSILSDAMAKAGL